MPPKKIKKKPNIKKQPKKKKAVDDHVKCEPREPRFWSIPQDDAKYNWWEVFCFPYIIGARVWDCCASLCSGGNQCLIYWLMIQWIICKVTKTCTPDPIIFPYYFYLFCQVILLTILFVLLWGWVGKTVIMPFVVSLYTMITTDEEEEDSPSSNITLRLAFRKYCFRKGEIFETSLPSESVAHKNTPSPSVVIALTHTLFNLLNK